MNVFMGTDLEGVAGVVSFTDQAYSEGSYYDAAKRLPREALFSHSPALALLSVV
ncbi:MAG: hypothetical protein JXA89_24035 [Anaerolineae bacterium]|nr:hypothetical protein [Anaerolineae bacterium]